MARPQVVGAGGAKVEAEAVAVAASELNPPGGEEQRDEYERPEREDHSAEAEVVTLGPGVDNPADSKSAEYVRAGYRGTLLQQVIDLCGFPKHVGSSGKTVPVERCVGKLGSREQETAASRIHLPTDAAIRARRAVPGSLPLQAVGEPVASDPDDRCAEAEQRGYGAEEDEEAPSH